MGNSFKNISLDSKADTKLISSIALGVTFLLLTYYATGIYLNYLQIKLAKKDLAEHKNNDVLQNLI